uniref:Nuclear cap-binding protein subunit 3 n=1 Tax=Tetraodon nigroviridis TaxID=99883 RepID=H3CGQ5_TETNG
MAAVRRLRVSDSGTDRSESDSDSESDRDVREAEPMEVEEGELEPEDISVNRSLKELLPDTSRRYENKAGAFITGIDVNSKEAIERKEKRARRFHFCGEQSGSQRDVYLDKELMKKAIPRLRLEAVYMMGVDDMSTQEIFRYFKEYPPAHIEWINDTSCNVVWLDDDTSVRALVNSSQMPEPEAPAVEPAKPSKVKPCFPLHRSSRSKRQPGSVESNRCSTGQVNDLSAAERQSLLRNELRPAIKPFKGNKLFLRFATQDDKKELGAARRGYYMKYGNPNYGGMKGILTNSWKRRYHNRRIQRDVIKSRKPLIGDSMGHTPPYTHRHSADLVNLPEEPIKEEEEEEEDEPVDGDEDMDSDDRLVEYRDRGEKSGGSRSLGAALRSRVERSPSPWSESDEMDYDLELKMISTPSPKKSKKMTMYADEVESQLKSIRSVHTRQFVCVFLRNRIGGTAAHSRPKSMSPTKVTDIRQLLEEKRQGLSQNPQMASPRSPDVRQRLGKRRYSPDRQRSPSPSSTSDAPPAREPTRDVHRRLGVAVQDGRGPFSTSPKDKKTAGGLWSRLGSATRRSRADRAKEEEDEVLAPAEEEDDSTLQKMWGAMIKQKQERLSHKMKKSRLDNLPSLQIEISRDSSEESDA